MNALINRYGWAPDAFPVPDGLEFRQIRNVSGARPGVSNYQEVFLLGQEEGARLQLNWMQPDQP